MYKLLLSIDLSFVYFAANLQQFLETTKVLWIFYECIEATGMYIDVQSYFSLLTA